MFKHKDFLVRMCEGENVTIQELQELTGKSKSVVYDWLNYSKLNCFPNYEALSKIICRLGITMDDFLKCKSDKLVNYTEYRTYKQYIVSNDGMNSYISESILDNPNCKYILNCYIDDCARLKSMVHDYLENIEIDRNEFDNLCKNIYPYVYSEAVFIDDIGDGVGYFLNDSNLEDYKSRTQLYNELCDENPEYEAKNTHGFYLPNVAYVLLRDSKEHINMLKKYIPILNNIERKILMEYYLNFSNENKRFDKNKRIFKLLYKNDCDLGNGIDEKLKEKYELIVSELYKEV